MVIDDEEFCIAAMKAMLGLVGVDVINYVDFCINGKEATEMIKSCYSNNIEYKIIFTDF